MWVQMAVSLQDPPHLFYFQSKQMKVLWKITLPSQFFKPNSQVVANIAKQLSGQTYPEVLMAKENPLRNPEQ